MVVNNGPSDAAGLTVTDTLPAGVTFVSATGTGWACSNVGERLRDLHAGGAGHRGDRPDDHPGRHGAGPDHDPDEHRLGGVHHRRPGCGEQHLLGRRTGVTASADLAITKTGPATVVAGGSVAYQLTVTDNGPSDAANLSVTDTLPAGVTLRVGGRDGVDVLERRATCR